MTAVKSSEAKSNEPTFMVRDETFHAKSSEGAIAIPLRFKTKYVRKLATLNETAGFFHLVDALCDEDTISHLDEVPNTEYAELAQEYFKALQKIMQATPGE